MPPLAAEFARRIFDALTLAGAGDAVIAMADIGSALRREWHITRVELLYELAYLRIFIEWETLLEQSFLRYLCGYASVAGSRYNPISGVYFATMQIAQPQILGNRQFVLWHNPSVTVARARQFLAQCPHEYVIASHSARLDDLAAIRHRIAHGQEDAKQKFDIATLRIAGRRYRGARPGRFLRDWDYSAIPARRWLVTLGMELRNLAHQIV
jgi:hypothetical protein